MRRHLVPRWQGFPRYGPTYDSQRETTVSAMEEKMKSQRFPNTDSVQELARFWDTHDLTDFESDLEEVPRAVFVRVRGTSLTIDLQPTEVQHLKQVARSKGLTETAVVRHWILERLRKSGKGPINQALHRTRQRTARR